VLTETAMSRPLQTPALSEQPLVAIGGIGGSGTRAVAQIMQNAGLHMGHDLNVSLDDLAFTTLFKRHAALPIEANTERLNEALLLYLRSRGVQAQDPRRQVDIHDRLLAFFSTLPGPQRAEQHCEWMDGQWLLARALRLARVGEHQGPVAWKEPNAHVVLPYLLTALPNLYYLHVIRHGLDMAFSRNDAQTRLWGQSFTGQALNGDRPDHKFVYWCAVHDRIRQLREWFPRRVILCPMDLNQASCIDAVTPALEHLGKSLPKATQFKHPPTVGRFRAMPSFSVTAEQADTLTYFGYAQTW